LGVYFIYVGDEGLQGDAILIKKGDLTVLVDAGPAEKAGRVVDFLRSKDVSTINVLISTNPDPRHYGGLGAVADNFRVQSFWWSGETLDDDNYSAAVAKLQGKADEVKVIDEGFSMDLNGINLTVLNPPDAKRFKDVNNDAIVMKLVDRNFSILLTSGIQSGAQGRLINDRPADIAVPIMEAPYYGVGAGTSNIGIFLLKAKPDVMIISGSADDSAANGGSREPFKRLMTQYGITWHENYVNGTLRITSDGSAYAIQALGS
jgi:competence protein ComEC